MELVLRDERRRGPAGRAISVLLMSLLLLWWVHPDGADAARKPMAVKIGRGEAKVTALEGSAQYASEGGKWRALKRGTILKGGSQVATGSKSRLKTRNLN